MKTFGMKRLLFFLPSIFTTHQCRCAALMNNGGKWGNILRRLVGTQSSSGAVQAPALSRDLFLQSLNLSSSIEPRPFWVEPKDIPAIFAACIPAVFRIGTGAFVEGYSIELGPRDATKYSICIVGDKQIMERSQLFQPRRIEEPLILYDREGSTSCRLVREACSILSLQVYIRPCPRKGLRYGLRRGKRGETQDLPILDDPNTGLVDMKDTSAILNYLFKTYGNGRVPWTIENKTFSIMTTVLAMASRFGSGSSYEPSDLPPLPLVLWSYEGSPFCKRVTERLGSLELEYKIVYCPRGSPNRQRLFDLTGRFQVPYLQDPNTGVNLWESSAICEYIDKQYALKLSVSYL